MVAQRTQDLSIPFNWFDDLNHVAPIARKRGATVYADENSTGVDRDR